MQKLILLRHGESVWNKENRFTGWTDVDLSDQGLKEAKEAGLILKDNNIEVDVAFTSYLKRAINTLDEVKTIYGHDIPTFKTWQLNERHYGALQGLNKAETALKYGEEQVMLWRRSAKTHPPLLTKDDPRYPGFDAKYQDLTEKELPLGENLDDTSVRVLNYYQTNIVPYLTDQKTVLISAHGNSLRALVKYLDNMSDEDVMNLNIPTGIPLIYELDNDLKPINRYYLTKKEA